jgi:hypothetical protein
LLCVDYQCVTPGTDGGVDTERDAAVEAGASDE